jgi:hypothetical protein
MRSIAKFEGKEIQEIFFLSSEAFNFLVCFPKKQNYNFARCFV